MTRPRRESSPSACHGRQTGALAEEGGGLLPGWAAEGGTWPADLGLARIKRAGRQHRAELVAFDRRDLLDARAWIEDRLAERLAEFAELAGGVPIVTRQDLDAAEPAETPIAAEVLVEDTIVTAHGLDPVEPVPVVLRVPVASATVVQAVAPMVLASSRPIVIAAAWGRASGGAAVAGQGLAVTAEMIPGQAFASAPLVIGCGPVRAHHVPARRVFVCRPCSVEAVPLAWMARPAGNGAALGLIG